MARDGLLPLSSEDGMALFDSAAALAEPVVAPVRLDVTALRDQGDGVPVMLRGVVRAAPRRTASVAESPDVDLAQRLAGLPDAERTPLLVDLVRAQVATVLGHSDRDAVGEDRAFEELGLDSLTSMELRNRLSDVTGLRLPATVVLEHPTAGALAEFLRRQLGSGQLRA
jgi:acyl carrier protein